MKFYSKERVILYPNSIEAARYKLQPLRFQRGGRGEFMNTKVVLRRTVKYFRFFCQLPLKLSTQGMFVLENSIMKSFGPFSHLLISPLYRVFSRFQSMQ